MKLFHDDACQENKFIEKEPLEKTFIELWKSIDAEIAAKSTKFLQIL